MGKRGLAASTLLIWGVCSMMVAAQNDQTRDIVPEAFLKARPRAPVASGNSPGYRRVGVRRAAPANSTVAELGITIWRLRPATAGDPARLLVQEPQATSAWTPQRIEVGTPLTRGDRIRISIESPRDGYLYVVDREGYADGTSGDPYLIFPTTRTRAGDNHVVPGRLVEVPGQTDTPPYFTLETSRPDQAAESITLIVAREPLPDIVPGATPLRLTKEIVADWERRGGAVLERLELIGGAGRGWSGAEQRAGADATRLLTQQDPPPQTVFRVAVSEPALIAAQFTLSHARAGTPARGAGPSPSQPAR